LSAPPPSPIVPEAAQGDRRMAERVLVLGASGYIGRHLTPRLATMGYAVTAAARRTAAMAAEGWDGVAIKPADALDYDSLRAALTGQDVVYYLVHAMAAGGDFPARDRAAAANLARAAGDAGVRRIVYLGGLAPRNPDTAHLASRIETGALLREGPVEVVEIRAGIVIGAGSAAFEVMRDLVAHLPAMVTPRWVRAQSPPVALDDLLATMIALARAPGAGGQVFEVGGPQRMSYEQMMRALARLMGRRAPIIIPVPLLTPELSSWWLALISATPVNVARALITGLRYDLSADDASLRAIMPPPATDFETAVTRVFEQERAMLAVDRWREGAFDLRGRRHDVSFYGKSLTRSADIAAPPGAVWRTVAMIGGPEAGYFALAPLWRARRWLERRLGGDAAPRRGAQALAAGLRFDGWRVLAAAPGARLTLVSTMTGPGAGGLEIALAPLPQSATRLDATLHWHPAGTLGLLYWFVLWPLRALALGAMARAIARRAAADQSSALAAARAMSGSRK